jgi:glucose/arabinose dehydrogenase
MRRAALFALLLLLCTACGGRRAATGSVYARGLVHASAFAYDAHGRLWVSTSGATTHTKDAVYVVPKESATPVKVIAHVRGPLGLVWDKGSLYVSTLDGVYRYSELTASHFASRTLILRSPVTGAENNNLVLAPNGRLVLGITATCDHCANYASPSGSIVSFTTDGTDLKVVARHVRAAYGLTYASSVLYATMNQRDDLGAKTPGDLLAVVRNGQDWRFPECYEQGGTVCDGVPTPLATLDKHAAAGGVAIVGDSAIVAEWNSGKVLAVSLSSRKTTVLTTSIANPLPVISSGAGYLVGDWATGVVYRYSS